MTDEEFAAKVDWEGGLYEALFGYGLKSTDLDNQDGVLAQAIRQIESLAPDFYTAMMAVEEILNTITETDDE